MSLDPPSRSPGCCLLLTRTGTLPPQRPFAQTALDSLLSLLLLARNHSQLVEADLGMAAFASLPPELVTRIVQLAAGPVVPLSRGDSDRCDILSRLSVVRLLRHAAQNELAYAVRVGSTEQLDAVRDKVMVGGAAVRILILDNRREVLPGETDPYEPPVAAFQATLRMVALIYFDHVDLAPLAALPGAHSLCDFSLPV